MAPLTAQRSMRSPAARPGSATCARVPIARRPTARRSALSGPCSAAGRTERSTARAQNGPPHLTAGSGATTICDDTRLSATSPQSLGSPSEPTCSGLTPRRGPARWRALWRWLVVGGEVSAAEAEQLRERGEAVHARLALGRNRGRLERCLLGRLLGRHLLRRCRAPEGLLLVHRLEVDGLQLERVGGRPVGRRDRLLVARVARGELEEPAVRRLAVALAVGVEAGVGDEEHGLLASGLDTHERDHRVLAGRQQVERPEALVGLQLAAERAK